MDTAVPVLGVILGIGSIIFIGFLVVWPILVWSHLKNQTKHLQDISESLASIKASSEITTEHLLDISNALSRPD